MRNGLRGALALAVACALAIGIAACGGGDSDSGSETTAGSDPAAISGTVTVWDIVSSFSPTYVEIVKKRIKEFEREYPGVTVEYVEQPFDGYEPVYRAAFAAQEGPDVMTQGSGPGHILSFSKGLEPLNDRISAEMEETVTNWNSVTEGLKNDGPHYGIPIGVGGPIFYYNKALFQKAGLPREFEPQSWDDVIEAGEKLKAAGIQPFSGGDKEGYESTGWLTAGWQTENTAQQSLEMYEGTLPITDEAFANALKPGLELAEAGLLPEDRFTTSFYPDSATYFAEGKAAITRGTASLFAYYGEFNDALGEKNVGMFLPPGSSYFAAEADWSWSIPKYSDDKDAAWALVEFMASDDAVRELVAAELTLPNRKGMELPASLPEQTEQLVEWSEELEVFLPAVLTVPVPLEQLYPELSSVMQGRTSVEDAQQSLQEVAEKTAGR